jgi:hypothetical protein
MQRVALFVFKRHRDRALDCVEVVRDFIIVHAVIDSMLSMQFCR